MNFFGRKLSEEGREKRKNVWFWLINVGVFLMILCLDICFPYAIDDFWYNGGIHTSDPLYALQMSLQRLMDFYYTWGGRLYGNFFAFFMSIMNKMVFNVCNAVVHVVLGCMIYAFIRPKKQSPWLLLLIYLCIWLFTPEYGMTVIWTNASTIYLWAQLPLLLFSLVYYRTLDELGTDHGITVTDEQSRKKKRHLSNVSVVGNCTGMLILGIIAGNSMEPTAATMIIIGFFWLCRCIKTGRGIRLWEIIGIAGFFGGFVLSIFSPGNAVRTEVVREIIGEQNLFVEILFRIIRESYYMGKFLCIPFGIAIALWVIACGMDMYIQSMENVMTGHSVYMETSSHRGWRQWLKQLLGLRKREPLFILAALLSVYMMTFSIAFAIRVLLAPTVLLIISMGISIRDISESMTKTMNKQSGYLKQAAVILTAFLCFLVMIEYSTAILEMHKTGKPFVKTTIFVEYNNDALGNDKSY